MKKILVVTGTRADYGIYYPLLNTIRNEGAYQLELLVTGMHLSPEFGNTIDEIRRDKFSIVATVDNLLQGSNHANMAKSIGLAILGMTQAFESSQPDFVVVLGDRGEMLAATIAATHLNIPVVHFHGGEVSGTIDESVRHAISKLSHIHMVATEGSKQRLLQMGEDSWRIHVVGAPRIETIQKTALPSFKEVKRKYGLNINEYYLFVYHPVTTETSKLAKEMDDIFNVLLESKENIICILPNSDAGQDIINSYYSKLRGHEKLYFIKNFNQLDYLTVLKNAKALIGNSSSGIIEAASFKIPVINIGTRQYGRERSKNTIDVNADYNEVKEALKRIKSSDFINVVRNTENVYGKGNTSEKFLRIIKNIQVNKELIQKSITY
ncbi:UDP-N-acetylglucosamine 2-epimerase [Bacillus toyonensis]|uniref:UDP-N-acetylglucosamine 2-epimerase n=1 Tax=Bacillus toyonensis TaxID=155322 RepID=UPI000BEDD429|nr:UDP-N-acetylglucosamine 2-epimerase [Bacillus toyonensis]PED96595.1 UDP-N-acetylglucosamine 2-epimerase (hydrolyzing) [Bacillus toyonensis]PEK46821.1 UDP-N-acetylglucosamine 2-epimerase (hydrolyzing) [Bacillus toyonensis]PEL61738.1 UDP-N-acetylglucosamine 2-epimerase (hydrolyzing) [Bacillus toyonensis]PFZ40379.1 UDP-N-acetylglucosamine 2-epimerase (hydrolyzing) [Bacillus toyonensis]UKS60206.1 UDP-N-acetylglucosamine 2-epimerase (hydrolyzing) [Bacillus toyonensis]